MKAKGFWARAFSDWPAKVLSFAAALLIFFFYRLNRLEERFISVPLSVVTNDEYVPASQYPRSVRLAVKGESNDLFQIQEEDLKASVDLSEVRSAGLSKGIVLIEKRGVALGIDPLQVSPEPSEIQVSMERKVKRIVPVTPAFHGYLDPGYNLRSFDLAPGEVEIAGPESVVARVVDVSTEPIELSGRMSDFSIKSKLVRSNPLVSIAGADAVEFRGAVQKSVAVKTFAQVAIAAQNLADWLALEEPLPAARLNVKSADGEVHSLELAPGAVSVDFSSVRKTGSFTLPVVVNLPPGLTLDSLEPATVTVRVTLHQGALRMIVGLGVDIVHVARIRHWIDNPGLMARFFHPDEIVAVQGRGNTAALSLAARFAAKEALGKALGTGLAGMKLSDIQVINNFNGKPDILLFGDALKRLETVGGRHIHLSLTHENENAVAVVVIED